MIEEGDEDAQIIKETKRMKNEERMKNNRKMNNEGCRNRSRM